MRRAVGQGRLQQTIELAGVARRLAGQVEGGEQFVAHRAGGGPGAESDLTDVLAGFELAQAGVDGEGLAEAGAAMDAHHRAGSDRVGDVVPGSEQSPSGDHGRVRQVDVLVGGRGHEASPSSSVVAGAARPSGLSGAGAVESRPDGHGADRAGVVSAAKEAGVHQSAGGSAGGTTSGSAS